MTSEKGKLVKQGKTFMVNLPTKKGSANFAIPEAAKRFKDSDASDGAEVDVERDDSNRIVKVTIPGAVEVIATVTKPQPRGGYKAGFAGGKGNGVGVQNRARRTLVKAPPRFLDMPFHNPYTFIPFPKQAAERFAPTLHSADEAIGSERFSGVLCLRVTTESPLLTCDPIEVESSKSGHKIFRALTIAGDVIVPATGVRGALRTLLTILTGGTLGYLNTEEILCQGRDANLGPRGINSPPGTPVECFLAEVVSPGTARKTGRIRLGAKKLVEVEELEAKFRDLDRYRSPKSVQLWVELDATDRVSRVFESNGGNLSGNVWRLKLSGRPVNRKGKREALYRPSNVELELPPALWSEYIERYKHGDRTDLRRGDLVWLMPSNPEAQSITKAEDVASLQWARWGRRGQKLLDLVQKHHAHVMPDSLKSDGKVDRVTDMFGQVSTQRELRAPSFAGRVLPENLVFHGSAARVKRETLAPLAQPHAGCVAFYRDNADPDGISSSDGLSGYKVYRTSDEAGDAAPWKFSTQGVYDDRGELKTSDAAVNKTCDLLPTSEQGILNIAFTALTKLELALLIQACSVPWRLGGGKPLGLGRCKVVITDILNETGELLVVQDWLIDRHSDGRLAIQGWEKLVQSIAGRVGMWIASQLPVARLRYPRAVDENQHKKSRGGHVWFQRHAQPRSVVDKSGQVQPGLNPMYIDDQLLEAIVEAGGSVDSQDAMIAGQPLLPLNPSDPKADLLFGYDGYGVRSETRDRPKRRVFLEYEPFDPTKHARSTDQSSGSHGKNKGFREEGKNRNE